METTLATPIGDIDIFVMDATHIRVASGVLGSASGGVEIHGVTYQLLLFMGRTDDGWNAVRTGPVGSHSWSESLVRRGRPGFRHDSLPSPSAAARLEKVLRPAITEWAIAHPETLANGELRHRQLGVERASASVREAQTALDAANAVLAAAAAELARAEHVLEMTGPSALTSTSGAASI